MPHLVDTYQLGISLQRRLPYDFNLSATYLKSIGDEVVEPLMLSARLTWTGFDGSSVATGV